jgi:bifunctional DNA-binding transcriptional regulator/antitoxin component of YhaV-PrlF toxin-antitoxin module
MRTASRKVTKFNGSIYALIPFYVAEPYGIDKGSSIEIDTRDPNVLVMKIRKEDRP